MIAIMKAHGGWVTGSRESGNRFVTHATWLGHSAPVQGRLKSIVASLTSDPSLRLDLLQEALLHLWKIQREEPGQTLSWYLQSCRFHLQHVLDAGRSLDAPKRRRVPQQFGVTLGSADRSIPQADGALEAMLSAISARDIQASLHPLLTLAEQRLLRLLADGFGVREIARTLSISPRAVLLLRQKIAACALKIGLRPPPRVRRR